MPLSTFDSSVLDGLVADIDEIRADIHAELGSRQHQVTLVRRLWSTGEVGDPLATKSFTQQQVISPPPLVAKWDLSGRLKPCGLDEQGEIVLVEVSLTYTEPELYMPTLAAGEEFYYRISDAHGQGIRTRYFVPSAPPSTIRSGEEGLPEHALGWVVKLQPFNVTE